MVTPRRPLRSRTFVAVLTLAACLVPLGALASATRAAPAPAALELRGAPTPGSTVAPPVLAEWGTKGSGNGQFDRPISIAVHSDKDHGDVVYVMDGGNYRVQKFDAYGEYITQFGRKYSYPYRDGDLSNSCHLAVAPSGQVYVLDTVRGRVSVFNPDGTFAFEWGSTGKGDDQFGLAWGIGIDSQGRVIIGDRDKDRVWMFTPTGGLITRWESVGHDLDGFKDLTGIAVARRGSSQEPGALSRDTVFILESNRVYEYELDGSAKNEWGGFGSDPGRFAGPRAIATDGSYVVVGDTNNKRFQLFKDDGTFVRQWRCNEPGDIQGVAIDRYRRVFAIDYWQDWVRRYEDPNYREDPAPPHTEIEGVDKRWHNKDVRLTLSAEDGPDGSGVFFTEARMQDWLTSVWSDWTLGPRILVAAARDHSEDGDRLIEYRAVDRFGNVEEAHNATVLIDTTPPAATVSPLSPSIVGRESKVVARIRVVEQLSPKVRFDLAVYSEALDKIVLTKKTGWVKVKRTQPYTWTFAASFAPGDYTVWAGATDLAGNEGEPASARLVVR